MKKANRKKITWGLVTAALLLTISLSVNFLIPETVNADTTGGWHLAETNYYLSTSDYTVKGEIQNGIIGTSDVIYDKYMVEGSEGDMTFTHSRRYENGNAIAHVTYQVVWDTPPSYIASGQKAGFNIDYKVVSSKSWGGVQINAHLDAASIKPGGATSSYISFQLEDGTKYINSDKQGYFESEKVIPEGRPGDKKAIILTLGNGYGYTYIYEWKEGSAPVAIPTAPAAPVSSGSGAEPFESGARIMWQPANGLGYRLFRSDAPNDIGISVTDFYITSTSYADVNVEPKTTYYYSVKPVLAEARPFEGIDEKLGDVIATFVVTTGDQVYKPGSYKHFIMLKLEDPNMSVDGVSQEVDPGRGTAPVVIAGRTMVPIRAVVEAIGGTVEWDGATKKITLTARGNTVEMWLGKTDIKINGESKKMDIAPVSKNDRTFVPVRFAAENLNCKVDWINSTKEAVIVYEE